MKNRFYTLWIAAICVVMFIFQNIIPGLTNALLLDGNLKLEIWRYVTSIFLHGSPLHLISNMFALLLFGLILESLIGSRRVIIVYFASGIIANVVAVFFYPSSLGASGAIFGILGVLTIIRPKMVVWVYSLPLPMFLAALVWIGVSLFGIFNPSTIGDIAHLSGIIVGFIFGFYYRMRHLTKLEMKADYSRARISIPEDEMRDWEDKHMRNNC